MRSIMILFFAFILSPLLMGQIEHEIRLKEDAEVRAILEKDTASLKTIWAETFTVNNPVNYILTNRESVIELVLHGRIDYTRFDREIEYIKVTDHCIITMGNETVVPVASGEVLNRRYTNIWLKTGGKWQIHARHANIICE